MYATFPSYYPNRAVRRAVKQNRMSRLSDVWRAFLNMNPEFLLTIKKAK